MGDIGLFDVTLATDDGHHIQAHKIILSAGSNFFKDIFTRSNYNNMLIYLKGINRVELESVIDFIYNGEALISHDELEVFMKTAKELDVKGFEGNMMETQKEESKKPRRIKSTNIRSSL